MKASERERPQLVSILSPVNHERLHQGWTQTSFYLQVNSFHKSLRKSYVFWACLHSAGAQRGNLHPARWPMLFCRPTQEPVLAAANQEKLGRGFEILQLNGPEGYKLARTKSFTVSVACMAIYWLTQGFKERTFKLCVFNRWDFNFCIRSSPLQEFKVSEYFKVLEHFDRSLRYYNILMRV